MDNRRRVWHVRMMLWSVQPVTSFLLGCIALASCGQPVAQMTEDELNELQTMMPGMTAECVDIARYGGITAISALAADECFKMASPQRFRGIWRNEFEGSGFCPEPDTVCEYGSRHDAIWLSRSKTVQGLQLPRLDDGNLYQIEFVGRMVTERGMFGHSGMYGREVVVDRVISLHPLPEPSDKNQVHSSQPGR